MAVNLISERLFEEAKKGEAIQGQKITADELLSSSLALTTLSASQVTDMLKLASEGSDDTLTSEGSYNSTVTNGTSTPDGQKAVFATAGNMTMLQNNVYSSLQQTLENQIQMVNALIASIEKELQDLNEAEQKKAADQAQVEQDKKNGYNYFNPFDPQSMQNYEQYVNDENAYKADQSTCNSIMNSPLFEGEVNTVSELLDRLQNVAKNLLKSLQILSVLVGVVENTSGKGGEGINALFSMEGAILQLQSIAFQNNSDDSLNHQSMGDLQITIMNANLKKITDEIAKLKKARESSHHHGIFGWAEDLVKSIINKIKEICTSICDSIASVVASSLSGICHELGAKGAADKLSKAAASLDIDAKNAISDFFGGFKVFYQTISDLFQGKNVAKDLFEIYMSVITAGSYTFFLNTSIGEDITQMGELLINIGAALMYLTAAAGAVICDQVGAAKSILNNQCENAGLNIISNPALQVLSDIAMLAMIGASIASGQLWMAAIMTALMIENDFGGSDCLANLTVDIVQACGAHLSDEQKAIIKVTVDAVVILAMTIAGGWAGGIKDAVGVGVEDVADAAEEADESTLSKIKQTLAQYITAQITSAAMTFAVVFGSSSIMNDVADLDKNNSQLKEALKIVQYTLIAISTAIGCVGMGVANVAEEDVGDRVSQLLKKYSTRYETFLEEGATGMMALAVKMDVMNMVVNGFVAAARGGAQIIRGDIQKTLADCQGLQFMMNESEEMNQKTIDQLSQYRKSLAKEYGQIVNNLKAPGLVSEGIANALLQNA